jgi:hypothetical protein
MKANEPWHTEDWFTSPWNFDEEVAGGFTFNPNLQIHDVTLRDGEQQAGVVFTADDKVRIAEALAEAGVHRIEAGLPAVSDADFQAVKRIAAAGLPSQIYAFSRCIVDDVKLAVDCGVTGIVCEVPSSRHLIELGYQWSVERAIDAAVQATQYAHEQGLIVSFFPIDATRASLADYLDIIEQVADGGHIDALGLVDTLGSLTPTRGGAISSRSLAIDSTCPWRPTSTRTTAWASPTASSPRRWGPTSSKPRCRASVSAQATPPLEETVMALQTLYNQNIGIKLESLSPAGPPGLRDRRRRATIESPRHRHPALRRRVGDSGRLRQEHPGHRLDRVTLPYLARIGRPGLAPPWYWAKEVACPTSTRPLERLDIAANDAQKLEILKS